jgi:hypothetical protein
MMVTLAMSVASGAVRIKALIRCAAEPMPSAQRSWRKPAQSSKLALYNEPPASGCFRICDREGEIDAKARRQGSLHHRRR